MSALTPVSNVPGRVAPHIVVHLEPVLQLSDEQLFAIVQMNRDLQFERNAWGELIIMPPTGGDTGEKNAEITMQLRWWAKQDKTGATFDSSTGFRLPNGAIRSPDAAWVSYQRLNGLTPEQHRGFIPLCPDFVIELRSPSDSLADLQEKMREYIENGAKLGWLLDTERKRAFVYRPDEVVQEVENPIVLSADPGLADFELDLREVW